MLEQAEANGGVSLPTFLAATLPAGAPMGGGGADPAPEIGEEAPKVATLINKYFTSILKQAIYAWNKHFYFENLHEIYNKNDSDAVLFSCPDVFEKRRLDRGGIGVWTLPPRSERSPTPASKRGSNNVKGFNCFC
jgi:hypothetical protein